MITMKPHAEVADQFARAIVAGDFEAAHRLLTPDLRLRVSPAGLKATFEKMIDYGDGPITHVEVMNTLEEWPARKDGDVRWAYAAMSGDSFCEAVTVVVARYGSELLIRELDWGRP
jgi:hypothetical protein